jgi:hypothetical protein
MQHRPGGFVAERNILYLDDGGTGHGRNDAQRKAGL